LQYVDGWLFFMSYETIIVMYSWGCFRVRVAVSSRIATMVRLNYIVSVMVDAGRRSSIL